MSILQKHLGFVKEQIEFQGKMAARFFDNSYRVQLHKQSQAKFSSLLEDLEIADRTLDSTQMGALSRAVVTARTESNQVRLTLSPEEIEDLPPDLLNELSISEGDKTEFAILRIIEESGGVISLDRLLVALYRKTGEVLRRTTLTSRLYRMGQKELVFSVPTKKGVYSSRPMSDEEAIKMFA